MSEGAVRALVSKLYALAPVLAPNVMPRGTTAEEEYKAFQTSSRSKGTALSTCSILGSENDDSTSSQTRIAISWGIDTKVGAFRAMRAFRVSEACCDLLHARGLARAVGTAGSELVSEDRRADVAAFLRGYFALNHGGRMADTDELHLWATEVASLAYATSFCLKGLGEWNLQSMQAEDIDASGLRTLAESLLRTGREDKKSGAGERHGGKVKTGSAKKRKKGVVEERVREIEEEVEAAGKRKPSTKKTPSKRRA